MAGSSAAGTSAATVADASITLTSRSLSGTAGTTSTGVLAALQDTGGVEPGAELLLEARSGHRPRDVSDAIHVRLR